MLVLEPRAKWAAHTPGVCHMEATPAGQLLDTGANTSACLATECFQGKARSGLQVGVVETHAHTHTRFLELPPHKPVLRTEVHSDQPRSRPA